MKKSILVLLLTFLSIVMKAQNVNNYGFFPVYSQSGDISKKLNYNLFLFGAVDVNKTGNKWFMFYTENTFGYKITDKLSFAASYVYQRTFVNQKYAINEHRVWQQIQLETPINSKFEIKNRIRFDERFVQNIETGNYPFSHRLRYLIGSKLKLNTKFYISAYNEFFFQTSKPRSAIYGENWAFVGLGINTSKKTSLDIGPTYITWVTNDNLDRLNLWYLQVQFNTTLNFTKNTN